MPAAAPELVGELARRAERVQRIARRPEVDERPDERRGEGQCEQAGKQRPRTARAPRPVEAREKPGLRAQQPGEREQRHDARPAARPLGLERRGPQHEGEERHVDVGPRGVEQQREARCRQQRRDDPGPRTEDRAAEPVDGPHERDEGEARDQHEHAIGVRAGERPGQRGEQEIERVLGRRLVGLQRRLVAVQELAPPDQVVVGVVVRIGADERPDDHGARRQQRDHQQLAPPGAQAASGSGGEGCAGATGAGGGIAASAVPTPSSAQVSGSSRNAA